MTAGVFESSIGKRTITFESREGDEARGCVEGTGDWRKQAKVTSSA
jgi:hypothetical protein